MADQNRHRFRAHYGEPRDQYKWFTDHLNDYFFFFFCVRSIYSIEHFAYITAVFISRHIGPVIPTSVMSDYNSASI
jgi:hypothetical protein